MLSIFRGYFGPQGTPARVEDGVKKPTCWRIQNVPEEWSEDQLLVNLQTLDRSLENLEAHRLSLYPAYAGKTQTALLNLEATPKFLQGLNPNQYHSVTIHGSKTEVDLSIDCHFHGLTPLNNPKGDHIIELAAPLRLTV